MLRNCKRWENHCPSSTIFVIWTSQVAISGKESTRQCRFKRCMYNTWVGMISWRRKLQPTPVFLGFPGGSVGKEFACNAWDLGSIPGLGRSPGEGKGYLLIPVFWPREFHGLYSLWGRKESDKTEWLSLSLTPEYTSKILKHCISKAIPGSPICVGSGE